MLRIGIVLSVLLASLSAMGPNVSAQTAPGVPAALSEQASLWEDYIHYYRVAQFDLSNSSGRALLDANLPAADLLAIVEGGPYRDYATTLLRAMKMEGDVSDVAELVTAAIRDAKLEVAREGGRVRAAIRRLDDGLRARANAQQELTTAGQYAAPQLLATLLSPAPEDRALRPYVMDAMVSVGREIVAPLCESLTALPQVTKQQVSEVLGRIGYPLALPYLKAELVRSDLDQNTRAVIETAYNQIRMLNGLNDGRAEMLFLLLGEDYYQARESLILEPDESYNLMWTYASGAGLTPLRIPTDVYHDAMAMRAARRALQLDQEFAAAMSLWLASNFRRENNLGGMEDPSYGASMRSPHFYATLFGPRHVQPVLSRALADGDAELALDGIRALTTTAGSHSLLNLDGERQPLIAAMGFPDRRVRFEAAMAIAKSVSETEFSGAQRVVPVLAEALREGDRGYAVIVASDSQTFNNTTGFVGAAGNYVMLMGDSIDAVSGQVADAAGVDLIIVNTSMSSAQAAVTGARDHYKLMSTPILVLAEPAEVATMGRLFAGDDLVFVANRQAEQSVLTAAAANAASGADGANLSDAEREAYALNAVSALRDLQIASATLFQPVDAKPALLEALGDRRDSVVLAAADMLTLFGAADAQQAIADAALNSGRSESMQVSLLLALAQSARHNGNQLTGAQLDNLLDLVTTARPGAVADAAADAHGALNLPTSNGVDLVIQ